MQPIKRCSLQNWWIHESWKVYEKDKGRHTSNEFDESTVSDCYFLLTDWLITLFCRASRSQIFVVVFVTTEFRGYIIKTECVAAKWDLGRRINAELCLPALQGHLLWTPGSKIRLCFSWETWGEVTMSLIYPGENKVLFMCMGCIT